MSTSIPVSAEAEISKSKAEQLFETLVALSGSQQPPFNMGEEVLAAAIEFYRTMDDLSVEHNHTGTKGNSERGSRFASSSLSNSTLALQIMGEESALTPERVKGVFNLYANRYCYEVLSLDTTPIKAELPTLLKLLKSVEEAEALKACKDVCRSIDLKQWGNNHRVELRGEVTNPLLSIVSDDGKAWKDLASPILELRITCHEEKFSFPEKLASFLEEVEAAEPTQRKEAIKEWFEPMPIKVLRFLGFGGKRAGSKRESVAGESPEIDR